MLIFLLKRGSIRTRLSSLKRSVPTFHIPENIGESPILTRKPLGYPNHQFGDGIMSAIDFRTSVTRKPDPKGDRVVITLDGKFLPYSKVGEGGAWTRESESSG